LYPDFHRDTGPAAGEELFLASVDQLHGASGGFSENCAHERVVVVAALAAEAAADERLDDADVGLGHVEGPGDAAARHEKRLGVHPERELAIRADLRHAADGLDGGMPLVMTLKGVLDHDVGRGEGALDVATL